MLQQLQQELPQIHMYEEELPRTTELEAALSDLYREIIVFCAHAIAVLHNNPNINLNERVWSRFRDRDFEQVIGKVGKSSRRVHEVADMIRLSKKPHTAETRAALAGSQDLQVSKGSTSPCYMIPYGLNLRFFGRDVELQRLKDTLDPSTESARLRAIGVYGLGGVGKSQLALQYANVSMESYNTIAWIPAETEIKLVQAVSNLAVKLGLTDTASEGGQSVQKVRDWLNQIKQPFLLIFDNVEDAGLLQQIWPANKEGSIIITTRSPLEASRRTTETLHLKSFTHDTAKDALEALVGRKPGNDEEEGAMREICRLVGGLPLAMAQISDFICGRDYSYREFLSVYEKSAEKVFAKSDRPVEYDHTLLTTYDISLQKLSTEATALLNLLAFFDPDSIPERLLANIAADLDGTQYEFLLDKFK